MAALFIEAVAVESVAVEASDCDLLIVIEPGPTDVSLTNGQNHSEPSDVEGFNSALTATAELV